MQIKKVSAAVRVPEDVYKRQPEKAFVIRIESIVLSNPNVLGIHDLVVHDYGPGRVMISLHAEVPASGDMLHLHDAIDNIERDLNRELHCEAVIHMDPVMNDDAQTQELKEKATVFLHELDASLNLDVYKRQDIHLVESYFLVGNGGIIL